MSLQALLIARVVSLLIFSLSFFVVTVIIEIDRRKHNRGSIGSALRNVAASSGLFLLSTASLSVSAIYDGLSDDPESVIVLLWIGQISFLLWLASALYLLWTLKEMHNGNGPY